MPNTFYPPVARSAATELEFDIDAVSPDIALIDGGPLPDGPNLATIGIGPNSETVQYAVKIGNVLQGCVRGYTPPGSAQAWPAGTIVARVFTDQDQRAMQTRIIASEGLIAAQQALTTTQGNNITNLQGRMNTAESNIATLTTRANNNDGDISDINDDINDLDERVEYLETLSQWGSV